MAYSEKVMDHLANPRNVGEMPDADGVGEVGNAKCGDIMKMYIKVNDGVITDVKFKTFGCGAAFATSSMATELIKGNTIEEALKLTNKAVMEALDGLPPEKCIVLFWRNKPSRRLYPTIIPVRGLILLLWWEKSATVTTKKAIVPAPYKHKPSLLKN